MSALRTTLGIAGVALLVLALVASTFARRWTMTLLLIALVIAGGEAVRSTAQRETRA